METIAGLAHPAKLHPHAVHLRKRIRGTLRTKHADLVQQGAHVTSRPIGQIPLGWTATSKQHWLALLGRGHWLFARSLLNQAIRPEKTFFSIAVKTQRLLEVNATGITVRRLDANANDLRSETQSHQREALIRLKSQHGQSRRCWLYC